MDATPLDAKILGLNRHKPDVFDHCRFIQRMTRKLIFWLVIFAVSAPLMQKPVWASGTIPASTTWLRGSGIWSGYYTGTALNACTSMIGSTAAYLTVADPSTPVYYCSLAPGYINWGIVRYAGSGYTCPANSRLSGTACTCNDPYVPDSAGTSCLVPAPTPASCPAGYLQNPYGAGCILLPAACPANMSGSPCACITGYVPNPAGAGCVLPACPAHASRNSPDAPCACGTGYKFDAAGASCISTCTVDPLPQPPFPGDVDPACTASLEKGAGRDVDHVCPPLNKKMTEPNGGQIQCLANKIRKLALPVPYTGPSATIRTKAYQQHFVDIWNKSEEIENKDDWLPGEEEACAAVISDVKAEMKRHGIDAPPSQKGDDAPHVLGNALDIPRNVSKSMIAKATMTNVRNFYKTYFPGCIACLHIPLVTGDVQDYVNSAAVNPPACNLRWGGRFAPYDPVHFQLP